MFIVFPFSKMISSLIFSLYFLYALILFADSLIQQKNIKIAFMSIWAGYIQLLAYGTGFFQEGLKKILKG